MLQKIILWIGVQEEYDRYRREEEEEEQSRARQEVDIFSQRKGGGGGHKDIGFTLVFIIFISIS